MLFLECLSLLVTCIPFVVLCDAVWFGVIGVVCYRCGICVFERVGVGINYLLRERKRLNFSPHTPTFTN
jgi:hypothetical protein